MRLDRRTITVVFTSLLIVGGLVWTNFGNGPVRAQESGEAKENGEASKDLKENLEAPPAPAPDAQDSDAGASVSDAKPGSDAGVSEESLDDSLLPAGLISNIDRERKRLAIERAELEHARKDLKTAEEALRIRIKEANARIAKEIAEANAGLEKRIEEARKKLDAKLKELKELKDKVAALKDALIKAQAKQAEEEKVEESKQREQEAALEAKITHLVKLCERMPPESAAPYIEGLEVDVAAAVLSRMKVRKAAAVIAAMRSSKAADLSKRYLQDDIPPAPGVAPKPANK